MKTILIVEDNEDLRELMGLVLRAEGYVVREAENGRDALAQLAAMSTTPSLLLLDLMMPVMDGVELLRILRERDHLSSLPVVILTACGQSSLVPAVHALLRKPVDLKDIVNVAHEICGAP